MFTQFYIRADLFTTAKRKRKLYASIHYSVSLPLMKKILKTDDSKANIYDGKMKNEKKKLPIDVENYINYPSIQC